MFHEVDAALVALVKDEALGDADVSVALDVPNRPWFAAVQRPTVNLFLYDVRENVTRRDVMHEPVLDDTGRIIGRRAPARRYDLYYLLSVWGTPDPALEHRLMAALVVALGRHDVIPEARVPEEHRGRGLWHLSVAGGAKRMMPGNFGGEMKLQAEVSVTVPLPPRVALPAGPPTDRPLDLRMSGAGGQSEQVQGRPPGNPGPVARQAGPVPRQAGAGAASADDPARQREQLARAVTGAAGPGGAAPGQRPGGPPGAAGQRPGGPPGAAGQRPPQDPMSVLRQALAQAAQAQAALAQAQAVIASAMGRPPGAGQRPASGAQQPAGAPPGPRPAGAAAGPQPAGAAPARPPAAAAPRPQGAAPAAPPAGPAPPPAPAGPAADERPATDAPPAEPPTPSGV